MSTFRFIYTTLSFGLQKHLRGEGEPQFSCAETCLKKPSGLRFLLEAKGQTKNSLREPKSCPNVFLLNAPSVDKKWRGLHFIFYLASNQECSGLLREPHIAKSKNFTALFWSRHVVQYSQGKNGQHRGIVFEIFF